MQYLYRIIKAIYFVLTIGVGIFFMRWKLVFPDMYDSIVSYVMPGYVVLCGLMIGYLVAYIRISMEVDENRKQAIYLQSFIIGIILWAALGSAYVLL